MPTNFKIYSVQSPEDVHSRIIGRIEKPKTNLSKYLVTRSHSYLYFNYAINNFNKKILQYYNYSNQIKFKLLYKATFAL
jgi:hypothetical protein